MSQTLADDSEVLFDQPEESAGALEPGRFFTEPTQEKKRGSKRRNLTVEHGPGRWTSTNRLMANGVPPRGEGGGRRYFPGGGIR